jgi:hypothetical protein
VSSLHQPSIVCALALLQAVSMLHGAWLLFAAAATAALRPYVV